MTVLSLYWGMSSSWPLGRTTRRSAPTLALAPAGARRASATSGASAEIADLILIGKPPLPRGSSWLAGDRSPGFRARLPRLPREPAAPQWLEQQPHQRRPRTRSRRSRRLMLGPVTVAG